MAIDPKLLVIKPVDELTEVTGLQDGDLLFYDGGGNLKRISIDTFNNLSKTAKPLKPTDGSPTIEGLYMPTEAGTYANAGGLVAQEGYYTLFFFDGINWTKSEVLMPSGGDTTDLNIILDYFLQDPTVLELDKTILITAITDAYGVPNTPNVLLQSNNTLAPVAPGPGEYLNAYANIPLDTVTGRINRIVFNCKPYGNPIPPANCNMTGIKEDGTVVPLVLNTVNPSVLNEYTFDVSDYEFVSIGWFVADAIPETLDQYIEFYKVSGGAVLNAVKNYIDANSGGGSNVDNTIIFAESEGVSPSKTGAENTTILNNIFTVNQNKGASVYLPAGIIPIAGTLNIYDTTSLIGAGRGSIINSQGGTVLKATTANVMINVTAKSGSDTGSPIKHMKLDGSGIATKGIVVNEGMAFFTYEDMCVYNCTDVCIETIGALIYTMRNIRIWNAPNGLRVSRTTPFQANHIRFDMLQFAGLTNIATQISGGGQVVFEQCDWEQNGTVGNINTGNMLIENMSPLNEGVDVTLNNCWSEYVSGGFWMKINSSAGVTTIRDTMLWRLTGDATNGIVNNGSKLFITGSTRINDFPSNNNIVTNGGETRVDGFTNIGGHTQTGGGLYKTVTYS